MKISFLSSCSHTLLQLVGQNESHLEFEQITPCDLSQEQQF